MTYIKLIFSVIIITLITSCHENKNSFHKTVILEKGIPDVLEPIAKNLPFKILSHSILKTNNDSINVYFGVLKQENQSGPWLALTINSQLQQFTTIDFVESPENETENNFEIEFNDTKNSVSIRIVDLDIINNNVTYSWINDSNLTDSLTVLKTQKQLFKGNQFPEIGLTTMDGKKFSLESYKNKIVVINWWAVWCAPCKTEIPGLNKLVEKYSNEKIKFIAITDDSRENVSNFLKKNEFKYEILFALENTKTIFGNSYPKNIVIDSSNTIKYYSEGGNKDIWKGIDSTLTVIK